MRLYEIVAENVEGLRLAQGLRYEELALRAGLSLSYAYMLARGLRSPPLDTLEQLAHALDTTVLYLVQEHASSTRTSDDAVPRDRRSPPRRRGPALNRARPPRASAGRVPG